MGNLHDNVARSSVTGPQVSGGRGPVQLDTVTLLMAVTCTPMNGVLPVLGTARDSTGRSETELRRQR